MSNQLILHCGAEATSRDDVYAIKTPVPSGRHYPVAHGQLLDQLDNLIRDTGYSIARESHGLTHDGSRYFGTIELQTNHDTYAPIIGLRNSHDQSFAASLVLGSRVFVCDNLSFDGLVKVARKHTRYIHRDIARLLYDAFGRLQDVRQKQHTRFERYRDYKLSDNRASRFILDAVNCKAIPAQRVCDVWQHWLNPPHAEFNNDSLWSLFNAFTEQYKSIAPQSVITRSRALHGACDALVGLAT